MIVGHGLAGAILAQTFAKHGTTVHVAEADLPHHASPIAAGLVNPLIGPKLNPPFDIEKCLQAIRKLNDFFSRKFGESFYENLSLHRIFRNQEQANIWKSNPSKISNFYEKAEIIDPKETTMKAPFGIGITKCLRLRIQSFLEFSKHSLIESDQWKQGSHTYDDQGYDIIIFCEGFRSAQNPWFSYLPFAPVRGEILEIEKKLSFAASNGTWAIPQSSTSFLAGSTWDHSGLEKGPTAEGKKKILNDLDFLNLNSLELLSHGSGVRNGTRDRNPIIGPHPQNQKVIIFNGFGSRGATTIPLYALKLVEFILEKRPLPDHLNLNRFQS